MRNINSYFLAYQNPRFNFSFHSGLLKAVKFILLTQFIFYTCSEKKGETLTIAVSANAQFALKAIASEYEKNENVQIQLISGSSGILAAQIIQGAPYDIFISADTTYPNYLQKNIEGSQSPKNYARGSLVLWSSSLKKKVSLELLKSDKVKKIAIANPETAPYGKASLDVLKKLNLYEDLKSKLVYGESISQCTQFIQSGAAQIGFTAESIMHSKTMSDEKNWIKIDTAIHLPMIQALLILNPNNAAIQFSEYVLSDTGQNILSEFGYFRPE